MLNFCEKVIQSKKIFKNFDLELEGEKNNKNISCGDIEAQNCVGIVSCLCIPVVSGYDFGSLLVTLLVCCIIHFGLDLFVIYLML